MKKNILNLSSLMLAVVILSSCNEAPEASISYDQRFGSAPLTVTFEGSRSSDEDGTIQDYIWEFPDAVENGEIVEKTFYEPGEQTVHLTVVDDKGAEGSTSATINVLENDEEAIRKVVESSLLALEAGDMDAFENNLFDQWYDFGNVETPPICSSEEALANMSDFLNNNTISIENLEIHEVDTWDKFGFIRYSMNTSVTPAGSETGSSEHKTIYELLYYTEYKWKLFQRFEIINEGGRAVPESTTEQDIADIAGMHDTINSLYMAALKTEDPAKDSIFASYFESNFHSYFRVNMPQSAEYGNCSDHLLAYSQAVSGNVTIPDNYNLQQLTFTPDVYLKAWGDISASVSYEEMKWDGGRNEHYRFWMALKNAKGKWKFVLYTEFFNDL